jgi:DNA-binding NtrC family response regulator
MANVPVIRARAAFSAELAVGETGAEPSRDEASPPPPSGTYRRPRRVLLVSERAALTSALRVALPSVDRVERAEGAASAIARLDQARFDLVVVDLAVARSGGIALVAWLRARHGTQSVLAIRNTATLHLAQEARGLGVQTLLDEGASIDELRRALDRATPLGA